MFFIQVFFENNRIRFNYNMDLLQVQKNREMFFDELEKIKNYSILENKVIDFDLIIKDFNKFKEKFSNIFLVDKNTDSSINFIIYDDSLNEMDKIIKFIKKYKNLNITLHLNHYSNFVEAINEEDLPNLQIKFENSEKPISYKEFYNMHKKLNEIIEFVKHYDLSPLEQVILIYDIVKANVYKKEEINESYTKSRNLNEIIYNDKIVCVGYANLINYLLTNLGFKNKCIITRNKETKIGHQKNYLYLEDNKYDIKGVFFLDVTADSKKIEDYIDNYKYFLRPFDYFDSKKSVIVSPKELRLLSKSNDDITNNISDYDNNYLTNLLRLVSFVDIKYSLIFLMTQLNSDKNKINELIEEVKDKYNINIGQENFKTALYKVRRIEYVNNITTKEVTEEYIDEVYEKNYVMTDSFVHLLKAIGLFEEININLDLANIKDIELDKLRLRLLKDLKLYVNNLPDNDFIKKMKK